MRYQSTRERFESKVDRRGPDECWPWLGSIDKQTGYGTFNVKQPSGRWVPTVAHRVAYRLYVGPIPDGLTIDHQCHNRDRSCPGGICPHRRCENPAHLEAATQQANFLRGQHDSATAVRTNHCKYGHEYTPENTFVGIKGGRDCRACIKRRNDARPRKG